jgi:hypothetical protein
VKPEAEKLIDYRNIAEADRDLLMHTWDVISSLKSDLKASKRWLLASDLKDSDRLVRLPCLIVVVFCFIMFFPLV